MPFVRPGAYVALILASLPLAACSGGISPLREMGLEADPNRKGPVAPDFVVNSRKGEMEYMPVGVSAPGRSTRARSETAKKALQSELEGARSANQAKGRSAVASGKAVGKGQGAPAPASAPSE